MMTARLMAEDAEMMIHTSRDDVASTLMTVSSSKFEL